MLRKALLINLENILKWFDLIVFAAIVAVFLSACAYSEINPEAALADIRANNGYYDLRDVEADTSRLILRSAGAGHAANFSVSTSLQACQGFTSLGTVAHAGRGVVYPWIANAVQRGRRTEPYIVYDAKPHEPVQVRGYGSWADGAGSAYRSGNCGPVVAKFTPENERAYTVEFVWGDKPACSLKVMDATNPDLPVPVPAEAIPGCSAPVR